MSRRRPKSSRSSIGAIDAESAFTPSASATTSMHISSTCWRRTRAACSTYVRPGEDIEAKVSAFSKKIGRPARTDLKLAIKGGPHVVEMYPPRLPDLFQGEQLQIVGRYEGHGHAKITLKGQCRRSQLLRNVSHRVSRGIVRPQLRRPDLGQAQGRLSSRPGSPERRIRRSQARAGKACPRLLDRHTLHEHPRCA